MFGVNILDEIDADNPEFYSEFLWSKFIPNLAPGNGPELFRDADALFLPDAHQVHGRFLK
jgi:hypothetical protein